MTGLRKWIMGLVYETILLGVLIVVLIAFPEKFSVELFIAWAAAFFAGFGAYVYGNVASKDKVDPTATGQ